ncbi:MAG: hypothetical protein ABFQ62_02680 [Patescibacteria group bacterium]
MRKKDWWIGIISLFFIVLLLDFINFDNWLYQAILSNLGFSQKPYYDLSFWVMFGAVGSVFAASMAWQANEAVKKQLKIEQEPYVVLKDEIFIYEVGNQKYLPIESMMLKVKNIGRGSALKVTINGNKSNPEIAFFEADQPHSIDLFAGEAKSDWKVDRHNLIMIVKEQIGKEISTFEQLNEPFYLYIHYSDQNGNSYLTEVGLECFGFSPGGLSAGIRQKFSLKVMKNRSLNPV